MLLSALNQPQIYIFFQHVGLLESRFSNFRPNFQDFGTVGDRKPKLRRSACPNYLSSKGRRKKASCPFNSYVIWNLPINQGWSWKLMGSGSSLKTRFCAEPLFVVTRTRKY
jgi:hypothetical protein